MFEVLVFVYENYYAGDSCPEPAHLERKLNAVGFDAEEVEDALNWLNGLNTAARVQQKTEELQLWMASRNLQSLGTPQLARYDPPWTLPMWRRNEVQIQVRQP